MDHDHAAEQTVAKIFEGNEPEYAGANRLLQGIAARLRYRLRSGGQRPVIWHLADLGRVQPHELGCYYDEYKEGYSKNDIRVPPCIGCDQPVGGRRYKQGTYASARENNAVHDISSGDKPAGDIGDKGNVDTTHTCADHDAVDQVHLPEFGDL
jgi:hypothetical protein